MPPRANATLGSNWFLEHCQQAIVAPSIHTVLWKLLVQIVVMLLAGDHLKGHGSNKKSIAGAPLRPGTKNSVVTDPDHSLHTRDIHKQPPSITMDSLADCRP